MHPQVIYLLNQPQPEQRTKEWYFARQSRITASAVSSLLVRSEAVCKQYVDAYELHEIFDYNNKSCNQYSSKQQFKLDKCRSKFTSSQATVWGNKYESVALDVYSRNNGNAKLIEFGLLSHKDIPWLAASPDSITEDGIMVEIKCPYRRKITGIPCLSYHQQVQIQMEVCDLELCDFAEYEFQEVASLSELLTDEDEHPRDKGVFIQIEDIPDSFDKRTYFYPDKSLINDFKALNKWASDKIEEYMEENDLSILSSNENTVVCIDENYKKVAIKTIYWKVMIESVVRIPRSREWFAEMKPILKKEWDEVIYYRDNVYSPEDVPPPPEELPCLF